MLTIFQIIGGLFMLFIGGEALVKGAVAVARNFGIDVLVISLTVVAIGTSMPEIMVNILAALDNHPDIAVGNILGSNISNIFLVLGASSIIYSDTVNRKLLNRDIPVMFLVTVMFMWFAFDKEISTFESIFLLISFVIYILYARYFEKRLPQKDREESKEELDEEYAEIASGKAITFIIIGCGLLAVGADILVQGAVNFAGWIGVPESVVAVTIVAIGSSAPELATCIAAAYHRHADIVAGNIVGSHILNIMLGIGISGTIMPLNVNQSFINFDFWVMFAATVMFALASYLIRSVNRPIGILFLLGYVSYITWQFV